jgi:hypothetical protein
MKDQSKKTKLSQNKEYIIFGLLIYNIAACQNKVKKHTQQINMQS